MKIKHQKASEILLLTLHQDDKAMPPDLKDAFRIALDAIDHILTEHNGIMPANTRQKGEHTHGLAQNRGNQP